VYLARAHEKEKNVITVKRKWFGNPEHLIAELELGKSFIVRKLMEAEERD
jgi:hypothetical protein